MGVDMGDSQLFRVTSVELPTCVAGVLVDQPQLVGSDPPLAADL